MNGMRRIFAMVCAVLLLVGCMVYPVCAETLTVGNEALGISAPTAYNAYLANDGTNDTFGIRFASDGVVRGLLAMTAEERTGVYGISSASVAIQIDLSMTDETHYAYTDGTDDASFVPAATVAYDTAVQIYDNKAALSFADEGIRAVLGSALVTKTVKSVASITFDKENATLYSRIRYAVTTVNTKGDTQMLYSDWTKGFSIGKAAGTVADTDTFDTPTVVNATVIGTEADQDKTLTFDLTLGEAVQTSNMFRYINGKGFVTAVAVLGVNGKSTEYPLTDAKGAPWDGAYTLAIPAGVIPANAMLTLTVYLTADNGTLRSESSALLPLKIQPADAPNVSADGAVLDTTPVEEEQTEAAPKCSLCKICPAPLGICVFIWIGLVLILIFAAFAVAHLRRSYQKKDCPRCHTKCDPKEKICPSCGYRFTTIMPLVDDEPEPVKHKSKKAESEQPKETDHSETK